MPTVKNVSPFGPVSIDDGTVHAQGDSFRVDTSWPLTARLIANGELIVTDATTPAPVLNSPGQFDTLKIRKADGAPITNSVALVYDDVLQFSIKAGIAIWFFEIFALFVTDNIAMDIKLGIQWPAAFGANQGYWGLVGSTSTVGWDASATGSTPGGMHGTDATPITTGSRIGVSGKQVNGVVVEDGVNAGVVAFGYSQNTLDPGNLQILKGSFLRATRLA